MVVRADGPLDLLLCAACEMSSVEDLIPGEIDMYIFERGLSIFMLVL